MNEICDGNNFKIRINSSGEILILKDCRLGSRIPRRRGGPTLQDGAPTYDFAKFSEKLHEIEKILGHGGTPP